MKAVHLLVILAIPVVIAAALFLNKGQPMPVAPVETPRDVAGPLALGSLDWKRGLPESGTEPAAITQKRHEIAQALLNHEFRRVPALVAELRKSLPRDLWACAVLSDAMVEVGEVDGAADEIDAFMALKPCGASYSRAAWILHLRGESKAAIETMGMAWEAYNPKDLEARAWVQAELGDLNWYAGDLVKAEEHFRKALLVRPEHPQSLAGLARLDAAAGRLKEALEKMEKVASTPQLLSELAFLHQQAGRKEAAQLAIRRGRHIGEFDKLSARSTALLLADHGLDPSEAVRLAQAEVDSRPGIYSWDALGWALCAAGKHEEAYQAATKAVSLGTLEPILLFHAGMAAAKSGHTAQAATWLGRALDLNPKFHVKFSGVALATLMTLKETPR